MIEPKRAYIVEDSDAMAMLYQSELERMNHLMYCGRATTVREALNGLESERPDVVILDLGLAEGSGVDVLDAYHKRVWAPEFVVVSNHTEMEVLRQCERLGARRVFDKSHGFFELLDYLGSLKG